MSHCVDAVHRHRTSYSLPESCEYFDGNHGLCPAYLGRSCARHFGVTNRVRRRKFLCRNFDSSSSRSAVLFPFQAVRTLSVPQKGKCFRKVDQMRAPTPRVALNSTTTVRHGRLCSLLSSFIGSPCLCTRTTAAIGGQALAGRACSCAHMRGFSAPTDQLLGRKAQACLAYQSTWQS